MQILIKAQLGLTAANLPDIVFRNMRGPFMYDVEGIKINVAEGSTDAIRASLQDAMSRSGTLPAGTRVGITVRPSILNITEFGLEATPIAIRPNIIAGHIVHTEAPPVPQARQEQPDAQPTPETICAECGEHLENCECERCINCDELIDNCKCSAIVDADHFSGLIQNSIQTLEAGKIEKEEDVTRIIASNMEGDIASKARSLNDKLTDYHNLFSRIVMIQREITRLTSTINTNETISKILQSSTALKTHPLVNGISFTNNYLIISTKELITDNEIDGHKRKIGCMNIFILLKAFTNASIPGTPCIRIINKTRNYKNTYQCGHVNEVGVPCWGGWMEQIIKTVSSLNIEAIFDLVIRFIKNPNLEDGWGSHLKGWPIAETPIEENGINGIDTIRNEITGVANAA